MAVQLNIYSHIPTVSNVRTFLHLLCALSPLTFALQTRLHGRGRAVTLTSPDPTHRLALALATDILCARTLHALHSPRHGFDARQCLYD